MKCAICDENVIIPTSDKITNTRNIAVKKGDVYLCIPCNDATMLFCETSEKRKIETPNPVKNEKKQATTKNIYNCPKCKKSYEGKICDGCNTPNPLFNRVPKKVKKKKKKRK